MAMKSEFRGFTDGLGGRFVRIRPGSIAALEESTDGPMIQMFYYQSKFSWSFEEGHHATAGLYSSLGLKDRDDAVYFLRVLAAAAGCKIVPAGDHKSFSFVENV